MSSGRNFNIYKFLEEKWDLKPNNIVTIDEKRTYKNYVEYHVEWKKNGMNGTHTFKVIVKQGEKHL